MQTNAKIYQSILEHLSQIPVDYLQQVDNYLENLSKEIQKIEYNRKKILKFAGAWNDMEESDFQEYLWEAKKSQIDFKNDIEL